VWLHHQNGTILLEPSAAITVSDINKVHRAVVFARPTVFVHVTNRSIHQHDAALAKKRDHAPVFQTDKAVAIAPIAVG